MMISCIQRCGKRQGQNRGEGLSGGEGVWRSSGKHLKLDLHISIKKKKNKLLSFMALPLHQLASPFQVSCSDVSPQFAS